MSAWLCPTCRSRAILFRFRGLVWFAGCLEMRSDDRHLPAPSAPPTAMPCAGTLAVAVTSDIDAVAGFRPKSPAPGLTDITFSIVWRLSASAVDHPLAAAGPSTAMSMSPGDKERGKSANLAAAAAGATRDVDTSNKAAGGNAPAAAAGKVKSVHQPCPRVLTSIAFDVESGALLFAGGVDPLGQSRDIDDAWELNLSKYNGSKVVASPPLRWRPLPPTLCSPVRPSPVVSATSSASASSAMKVAAAVATTPSLRLSQHQHATVGRAGHVLTRCQGVWFCVGGGVTAASPAAVDAAIAAEQGDSAAAVSASLTTPLRIICSRRLLVQFFDEASGMWLTLVPLRNAADLDIDDGWPTQRSHAQVVAFNGGGDESIHCAPGVPSGGQASHLLVVGGLETDAGWPTSNPCRDVAWVLDVSQALAAAGVTQRPPLSSPMAPAAPPSSSAPLLGGSSSNRNGPLVHVPNCWTRVQLPLDDRVSRWTDPDVHLIAAGQVLGQPPSVGNRFIQSFTVSFHDADATDAALPGFRCFTMSTFLPPASCQAAPSELPPSWNELLRFYSGNGAAAAGRPLNLPLLSPASDADDAIAAILQERLNKTSLTNGEFATSSPAAVHPRSHQVYYMSICDDLTNNNRKVIKKKKPATASRRRGLAGGTTDGGSAHHGLPASCCPFLFSCATAASLSVDTADAAASPVQMIWMFNRPSASGRKTFLHWAPIF